MKPYAAFGRQEHEARLDRARGALAEAGFDLCISFAPETHYHLAGYDAWVGVNSPQALVFSSCGEEPPTLLLRDVDRPLAEETSFEFRTGSR